MQWFRLYDDLLDDPKCQKLSPALFKHWINLLCLASKNGTRGQLPDVDVIAFRLRLSEEKARDIIAQLGDAGLIDCEGDGVSSPHNWKERQYGKPSNQPERVAARVAKHRETQRNADVTPLQRDETPLYTDTENTPLTPQGGAYSAEFLEFWKHYPKKRNKDEAWRAWRARRDRPAIAVIVTAIVEQKQSPDWLKDGGQYIQNPATWIRGGGWKDEAMAGSTQNGHMPPEITRLPWNNAQRMKWEQEHRTTA